MALKKGTYGHIQSAACMATRESVTAAHNKCLNELLQAVIKHRKKKSSIVFVKEDKDASTFQYSEWIIGVGTLES